MSAEARADLTGVRVGATVGPGGRAVASRFPGPGGVGMTTDRPHVRLGLAWAGVTVAVTVAGPRYLAVWLAVVGALAGAQVAQTWPRTDGRPRAVVAVIGGGLVPLAAVAGALGEVAGVALVAALALAWDPALSAVPWVERTIRTNGVRTLTVAVLVGSAAGGLVAVRQQGLTQALVMLTLVSAYDASAYLVGAGSSSRLAGPVAGVASVAALTIGVAAVLVPPFRGISPWVLGGLVAVLAPAGPHVASALLGDRGGRVAVLRRLDSMLLVGPAWAVAARLLTR